MSNRLAEMIEHDAGIAEQRRMDACLDGMEPPMGPCEICHKPHDGDYAVCDDCAPEAPTCADCGDAPVSSEGQACGPCSLLARS
jgi:hypothetical protein